MEFMNQKMGWPKGMSEPQDFLLKKKFECIESKMTELKKACIQIYRFNHYRQSNWDDSSGSRKDAVNGVRKTCDEIFASEWNESSEYLNIFKAKAGCFLGSVFTSEEEYDEALTYLEKAKKIIETNTLQLVIPDFYVQIHIQMIACHMEKQSPTEVINNCVRDVEPVLPEIKNVSSGFALKKLELEWTVQKLLAENDAYGQRKGLKEQETWELLKESEKLYAEADEEYKKNRPDEVFEYKFEYKEWQENMDATIQTTKGEFFKSLYLIIGGLIRELKEKNSAGENTDLSLITITEILCTELESKKRTLQRVKKIEEYRYIENTLQDLESSLRFLKSFKDIGWENNLKIHAQKIQKHFLELAFSLFGKTVECYPRNTICLDNIAALLYDYNKNMQESGFLLELMKMYCPQYVKGSVKDCIRAVVDKVLTIESSNMFALNIKTAITDDSLIPGEVGDYPTLRQSTLKRRFEEMKNNKDIPLSVFENIEMALIVLHSRVVNFMNSAIIDCSADGEWRDLPVGHYTKMKTLPKLINKDANTRFQIRNVHHLNDPSEGVILIKQLKGLFSQDTNPLINRILELYDSDKSGAVKSSVYMGSFTSCLDQLNMWDRYGDNGQGVSLQFDSSTYFDKDIEVSLSEISTNESVGHYKRENIKNPLYMVIYLPDQTNMDLEKIAIYNMERADAEKTDTLQHKWWKKQSELVRNLEGLLRSIRTSLEQIQEFYMKLSPDVQASIEKKLCDTIMVILDLIRFLVKNDFYRDEQEYRVIRYASDPECADDGSDVPKLYISIEREAKYKKVCFGPLVKDFESKAAYILNIKKENKETGKKTNLEIEVSKSSIPYRE